MTSVLETRRKAWDVIFNDPNLSLNSLRHRAVAGTVCQTGLRSVCWKIFLGYLPTLEVSTWSSIQLQERQRYSDLRRKYIDEPAEQMNKKGEEDLTDNNPLALNESNPWQQFFADSEIRKVIRQDVERTFPDVDFFRQNDVQQRLTDILFIYCKLNRDVSYRQGMHELLAPFYWIIALESLDTANIDYDPSDPATKLMTQVLDSAFVEHDAYILFDKLMTYGKSWYEFNDDVPSRRAQTKTKSDVLTNNIPKPTDSARLNPIVMTCHRIHHQYLRTVDPLLYKHLENFGIEPQLYGIRWIRLLFGREFDIYDLLKLWDAIFAQDPTLKIVDYICLVILLRMRDQLLSKDYAECLSLLMRPPQISKPASLVDQAKHLQDNLSQDVALQILQQNDVRAGKEPRTSLSDGVVEFAPPSQTNYTRRTLQHRSSQGSNLDSSFSRITSGMMKNPQMRDFNKAIAGVMGTVQKNVNTFGDNVLGRNEGIGSRRSTVSSEFPSGIDRVAISYKQERVTPISKSEDRSVAKLQAVNRQMGDMMAKCISILENEIFPPTITKSITTPSSTKSFSSDKIDETNKSNSAESSTMEEKNENNDIVEYEGSESSVNLDDEPKDDEPKVDEPRVDEIKEDEPKKDEPKDEVNSKKTKVKRDEPKAPVQNEASMIMALAGLKHVRDVLLGKQQFDSSAIDIKLDEKTSPDINSGNDEWKWDLVDRKEATINSSTPPLNDYSQSTRTSVFIPQTSSSLISNDMDSSYVKDKPLPPIIDVSYQASSPVPKLPSTPITYVPTNPTPPKQPIKYRIEDLLSDPELQLSSPKASNNTKFKWMLSNEKENQQDPLNHSSSDLFKAEQPPRMSPRKRSSFIINKTTTVIDQTNESSVDPLDAKNVDNRKAYEFDMF